MQLCDMIKVMTEKSVGVHDEIHITTNCSRDSAHATVDGEQVI